MTVIGVVGERAAEAAAGPGSFQPHFLDGLYHLESESLQRLARIQGL